MIGRAPSVVLKQTFGDAIDTFNDAKNVRNYNKFRQYLYPTDNVFIKKVDDPMGFVQGDPDEIIDYLNARQAKKKIFAQFFFKNPHSGVHKKFGDVTGEGIYEDNHQKKPKKPVPQKRHVRYCLRFKKNGGVWLLVTALLAPT
jgi:hypothetical protein